MNLAALGSDLSKYSTGNTLLDYVLIATLLPIIASYVNVLFGNVKSTFEGLIHSSIDLFTTYLKSKICGECVLTIEIDTGDVMFNCILNSLKKYPSDDNGADVFDESYKFFERSKYRYSRHKIELDYENMAGSDATLKINNAFDMTNLKNYGYMYKNHKFIVKVNEEKVADNVRKTIIIKVISYLKNKSGNMPEKSKILNDFLKNRLMISENLKYIYMVKITDSRYRNIISNGIKFSNSFHGLLTCSDNDSNHIHKLEKISGGANPVPKRLILTAYDEQSKKSIYQSEGSTAIEIESNDSLFTQYMKKYAIKSPHQGNYGFFFKGDLLVLITQDSKAYYMTLISPKICTLEDIDQSMNYFISKCEINRKVDIGNSVKENTYCYRLTFKGKSDAFEWNKNSLTRREFDTVYLPSETLNIIRNEFRQFTEIEKLYNVCQIPYRRGILFYGPPGTGKTSLVKALSYEYQMNIYIIDVNDENINDESIINILGSLSATSDCHKILLFEDIDSAFADKEKLLEEKTITEDNISSLYSDEKTDDKSKLLENIAKTKKTKFLTYSGLLNALDGALSNQNGIVTVMTTNYITRLGEALLRPGRIDTKIELKECNREQIILMCKYLINKRISLQNEIDLLDKSVGTSEFIENPKKLEEFISAFADKLMTKKQKIKPCELQAYILRNISRINDIFANVDTL